jgi:hypothetical protein
LPFYAILRSIPNKLLGVIAMFSAILILLSLPILDLGKLKGMEFKPLLKVMFFIFVANFVILMVLGAKHVESPYIELGQISAGIYFCFFVYLIPFLGILGNICVFISNLYKNPVNNLSIPKPYAFLTTKLESNLELTNILVEINTLLPQLSNFLTQFNSVVIETGVNVVSDSVGNMAIDVPNAMPDVDANNVSKRLGIIDRLITSHGNNINDLFNKGLTIENKLQADNPKYTSQLTEKIEEFRRLNASYKH